MAMQGVGSMATEMMGSDLKTKQAAQIDLANQIARNSTQTGAPITEAPGYSALQERIQMQRPALRPTGLSGTRTA
jgi:hypothetical protein